MISSDPRKPSSSLKDLLDLPCNHSGTDMVQCKHDRCRKFPEVSIQCGAAQSCIDVVDSRSTGGQYKLPIAQFAVWLGVAYSLTTCGTFVCLVHMPGLGNECGACMPEHWMFCVHAMQGTGCVYVLEILPQSVN